MQGVGVVNSADEFAVLFMDYVNLHCFNDFNGFELVTQLLRLEY